MDDYSSVRDRLFHVHRLIAPSRADRVSRIHKTIARDVLAACQPDLESIRVGIKIHFMVGGEEAHGVPTSAVGTRIGERAVNDA